MTNKTELLPCPFCYSDDVRITRDGGSDERCGYNFTYTASCGRCNARITVGSKHDKNGWCNEGDDSAKRRCADHWNTRAAPAEDVRAVADGPVGYAGLNGLNTLRGSDGYLIVSVRPERYLDIPLYRHPQSPVVLPERRKFDGWSDITSQDQGWNACLDEFARLNKQT